SYHSLSWPIIYDFKNLPKGTGIVMAPSGPVQKSCIPYASNIVLNGSSGIKLTILCVSGFSLT
ncbi:MAG: hypothetical protein WB474_01595, partial [Nitrososphaeraceae archaeon]